MTQAIVLITAVLTCLAATVVPLRFLPMIVAISVGAIMMLHGILARPRLNA